MIADDEVLRVARRYRTEAVACLVAVTRDESAPASARANAATKIIEITEGRPRLAKTLTRADVVDLPEEVKRDIFDALLLHFTGEGIDALLADIPGLAGLVDQPATKRNNKTKTTPVPKTSKFGFTRGEAKPRPRHHPPGWGEGGYRRPGPALPSPPGPLNGQQQTATAASQPAPASPGQGRAGAAGDGADGGDAAGPAVDPRLQPTSPGIGQLRYGLADQLPVGVMYDAFGNPTRWRH